MPSALCPLPPSLFSLLSLLLTSTPTTYIPSKPCLFYPASIFLSSRAFVLDPKFSDPIIPREAILRQLHRQLPAFSLPRPDQARSWPSLTSRALWLPSFLETCVFSCTVLPYIGSLVC